MVGYHTGPILLRALEAALAQSQLREVILVDNGNDAVIRGQVKAMAARHEKLKHRTGHGNVGFAGGCNLGAAQASGDYLLFLNPDCILPNDVLPTALEAMQQHKEAWLAGANLVDSSGHPEPTNRRNILTPITLIAHAFRLHRFFPQYSINLEKAQNDALHYVPSISGAFMLMKRSRYQSLGGIDEGYFLHVEDLDLCKTIETGGGKMLFLPHIRPLHLTSSSRVTSWFVERHKTAGFVRYLTKHYRTPLRFGSRHLLISALYLRLLLKAPLFVWRGIRCKRVIRQSKQREARQSAALTRDPQIPLSKQEKMALAASAPVMVTGSAGQLGMAVIRHLLACELETVAYYHKNSLPLSHPKLHWQQADFTQSALTLPVSKATTLIHTLPIWLLPEHITSFAEAGIKRLIAFSSTSAISKANSPSDAERELAKRLQHAEKTLMKQCKQHGIRYTIFRPTLIYGSGLDQNVTRLADFMRRFHMMPIVPPASGLREPVHHDDLALTCMQALLRPESEDKCFTLSGGETLSYRAMLERLFSTLGQKPRFIPMAFLPRLLDSLPGTSLNGAMAERMNKDLSFDHSEAKKCFGYAPQTFLAGGKADLGLE